MVKAWQGSSITVDNVASWYFTKTRHVNKITWPGHYIGLGVRRGIYRVPIIIDGKVTRDSLPEVVVRAWHNHLLWAINVPRIELGIDTSTKLLGLATNVGLLLGLISCFITSLIAGQSTKAVPAGRGDGPQKGEKLLQVSRSSWGANLRVY